MKEPTYPIFVALALMLAAPSFSAFGQRGERDRFEERIPLPQERSIGAPREQTIRAPEQQTTVRTQTFGGRDYHGQLAWRDVAGITRHATVGTVGGGMWADSGISIPSRAKARPTTCLTLRLRMTRRLRQRRRPRPRQNPTMLSIIAPVI